MQRLIVESIGRCLLSSLTLLLVAGPAHAQFGEWIKKGADAVEQRLPGSRRQQPSADAPNKTVDQVTALVGLTAMGVCGKQTGNDKEKQLVCMAGGIALTSVTKLIGDKIAAGLKERDQREILTAASESLQTGEPTTVTLPESGSVVTITPSADGEQKSVRLPIYIDAALVSAELPTLHVIGSPYRASQKSNLAHSEADKARTVGSLNKDEDVHVLGKAADKLLVARWVMAEGDLFPQPMAIGYAPGERLAAAEDVEGVAQEDIESSPATRKSIEVDAIVTCRDIAMKREDTNGKVIDDTARRCNGPAGIPLDG